jgi:hypothetical protein
MRRLSARRNRPATSPSRRAQSRTASSTASPSGEVVISSSLRVIYRDAEGNEINFAGRLG